MTNWIKKLFSNKEDSNNIKSIQSLSYDEKLKTLQFEDIIFNLLEMDLPEPYYKDYSHNKSETARNHKSYDNLGFRSILLEKLSTIFNQEVIKLFIITPIKEYQPYNAFAYLKDKSIVPILIVNKHQFKVWMDIIFKDNYDDLNKKKADGQIEIQPELNPNPQFMLILSKGQYSIKGVNSGMKFTEKPFENTGEYLYKNAPKIYNLEAINAEKTQFLQSYINTTEKKLDFEDLKNAFEQMSAEKSYIFSAPSDNTSIYETFESQAGYAFPNSLKLFYSLHSKIENSQFLTPKDVLREWQNWLSIYMSPDWSLEDLTYDYESDNSKTLAMYTNPYWIPFFDTGGGNFLAIDLAPNEKGRSGQIIAFGADEMKIRFIAEDLVDFIKKYTIDEEIINNGY